METRERKFEKFTEVMTVVALRKVEFYNRVWDPLSKQIPEDFAEHQIEDLKDAIKRIISHMSNELFLSDKEIQTKKINAGLKISEIGIDQGKLINDFFISLKEQYPDLKI